MSRFTATARDFPIKKGQGECYENFYQNQFCGKLIGEECAIELTAIVGGKICIIQPDNLKSDAENNEIHFELLAFAKEYGVKMATENMWNWDLETNEVLTAAC